MNLNALRFEQGIPKLGHGDVRVLLHEFDHEGMMRADVRLPLVAASDATRESVLAALRAVDDGAAA